MVLWVLWLACSGVAKSLHSVHRQARSSFISLQLSQSIGWAKTLQELLSQHGSHPQVAHPLSAPSLDWHWVPEQGHLVSGRAYLERGCDSSSEMQTFLGEMK